MKKKATFRPFHSLRWRKQHQKPFPRWVFAVAGGLLVIAILFRWILPGLYVRLPADLDYKVKLVGNARLLPIFGVEASGFPIEIEQELRSLRAQGDRIQIESTTRFNENVDREEATASALLDRITNQFNLEEEVQPFSELLLSEEERVSVFWLDRKDGTFIDRGEKEGLHSSFPVGNLEEKNYNFWDHLTERAYTMEFQNREEFEGLPVNRYEGTVDAFNIGIFDLPDSDERVRLDLVTEVTMLAERETAAVADLEMVIRVVAEIRGVQVDVMTIGLQFDEDTQQDVLDQVKTGRFWLRLVRFWIPLLLLFSAAGFVSWPYMKRHWSWSLPKS